MKLNHAIPNTRPQRIIQQFGQAKLVRHRNGRHELIGGTAGDFTAAREWVSLFAHDIVFSSATAGDRILDSKRKTIRTHCRSAFYESLLILLKLVRYCFEYENRPRQNSHYG